MIVWVKGAPIYAECIEDFREYIEDEELYQALQLVWDAETQKAYDEGYKEGYDERISQQE